MVLDSRVAMLQSGLDLVESAVPHIEGSRTNGAEPDLQAEVTRLTAAIRTAIGRFRALDPGQPFRTIVNDLEDSVPDELPQGQRSRQFVEIDALSGDFEEEVAKRRNELAEIEAELANATSEPANGDLGKAWSKYLRAAEECRGVFAEYVDLVRGVVLRDAGLDRDLCRIADELVRIWGAFRNYMWHSCTVPAAEERGVPAAAGLIRLGFPEWSVWSLPLAAYAFGHDVFAREHRDMERLIEKLVQSSRRSPTSSGRARRRAALVEADARSWIADAFATATMGPAYVCAAMLLRAEPAAPADRDRVEVMLRSLDRLDKHDEHGLERDRLRAAWDRATSHVATGASPDRWTLIDSAVREVFEYVRKPLTPAAWAKSLDWCGRLESDPGSPAPVAAVRLAGELAAEDDLRIVLVAAWYARLRLANPNERSPMTAAQHRDHVDRLAERARLTCIHAIDAPPLATGGSAPTQPARGGRPASGASDFDKAPPPGPGDT